VVRNVAQPAALSRDARQRLQHVSTATLSSQLLNRGFRNTFIPSLIALRPDLRMVGTAFTLRYAPTREDFGIEVDLDNDTNVQRVAVETIGAGQVLVIDARGDISAASFGHIIATRIKIRGAAGLVSDGALRDTPAFKTLDLPAYARAAHAATSSVAHLPVDMSVPIGCGGVLVMPGDVIVGDAEGVVVIPATLAEEVAHDAFEQEKLETFILERVQEGSSIRGMYPPDNETHLEYMSLRDGHLH
jgi:regulator of RNase E activity RraA